MEYSLSPEMAIRISKATNTSAESWMNKHEPKNVTLFPLKRKLMK